jgi:arylsulfatase A-like enzyme
VQQAGAISLRQGKWKLIEAHSGPALSRQVNIETGNAPERQLYDLTTDPGETRNLAEVNSARVEEMQGLLKKIREN